MRRRHARIEFVIAVVLLSGWAIWRALVPGHGQTITLEGVARSYSASYFVRTTCSKFFRVNADLSLKQANGVLEFGSGQFGRDSLRLAIENEMDRRRREVEVTGAPAWCSYQRASMTADGWAICFAEPGLPTRMSCAWMP